MAALLLHPGCMSRALPFIALLAAGCATAPTIQHGNREYPIVLIHGLSGFRSVAGVDYFFEVPQTLKNQGFEVFVTATPPWAPVGMRSAYLTKQLKEILRTTGARKLHLVAHSMGGLDARESIHDGELAPFIATLTTIGTPHRGSEVADSWYGARFAAFDGPRDMAANMYAAIVGSPAGFNDSAASVLSLSTKEAEEFNRKYPDDARVQYFSFAGRTLGHDGKGFCDDALLANPEQKDFPPPNMIGTALLLSGRDPAHPIANDGMVTVPSARWGTFIGCLPANHMKLVGHPVQKDTAVAGWDHLAFYVRLASWLTGRDGLR